MAGLGYGGGGGSRYGRWLFLSELGFDGVVVVSRWGGGVFDGEGSDRGEGGNKDFVRGFVVGGVVFGRLVAGGGGVVICLLGVRS